MEEIFPNIPDYMRKNAELVADLAFRQKDAASVIKVLNNYTKACPTQEEQEFVEFYFNMRMEQMLNER